MPRKITGSKIILRDGGQDDFLKAGKLIYSTGGYFFDYIFEYKKKNIVDILGELYKKEKGVFSHRFSTLAIVDNNVVGIELGYNREIKFLHTLFDIYYVAISHKPMEVMGMLYRNHQIKKILTKIKKDSYYIAHLAVSPEVHRNGIGSKLVGNAIIKARKGGYKTCSLDVSIKNDPGLRLYEKLGFKIVKEIRDHGLEKKYGLHGQYRMIKKI